MDNLLLCELERKRGLDTKISDLSGLVIIVHQDAWLRKNR